MKRFLAAAALLLCGSAAYGSVDYEGATGGSYYLLVHHSTPFAVAMSAGTGLNAGHYSVADAAILAAAPSATLASGVYATTVRSGTAGSAAASDTIVGTYTLDWTGTAERSLMFSTAGYLQADVIRVNNVSASSLLTNVSDILTTTNQFGFTTNGDDTWVNANVLGVGTNIVPTDNAWTNFATFWAAGATAPSFTLATLATRLDAAVSTAGSTAVSADVVDVSRTWQSEDGARAANIVTVYRNFTGTLALKPKLNPRTVLSTTASVSITGAATVTATGLTVNRAKDTAQFTVPALSTAGTYTVLVTVTTVDGQTIPTTATLIVR